MYLFNLFTFTFFYFYHVLILWTFFMYRFCKTSKKWHIKSLFRIRFILLPSRPTWRLACNSLHLYPIYHKATTFFYFPTYLFHIILWRLRGHPRLHRWAPSVVRRGCNGCPRFLGPLKAKLFSSLSRDSIFRSLKLETQKVTMHTIQDRCM